MNWLQVLLTTILLGLAIIFISKIMAERAITKVKKQLQETTKDYNQRIDMAHIRINKLKNKHHNLDMLFRAEASVPKKMKLVMFDGGPIKKKKPKPLLPVDNKTDGVQHESIFTPTLKTRKAELHGH